MVCKNCGSDIGEDEIFCSNCGEIINASHEQEKAQNKEIDNVNEVKEEAASVPAPNVEEVAPVTELSREVVSGRSPSVFYKLLVLFAAASAVIQIVLILKESEASFESYFLDLKLMATTVCVFGLGILNINYANLYDKGKNKFLAVIGMCFSTIVCLVIVSYFLGIVTITSVGILKILAAMLAISLAIYHAAFILVCDYRSYLVEKLAIISRGLITITYGFIVASLFITITSEILTKLFSISAILTIFMTIATLLLNNAE